MNSDLDDEYDNIRPPDAPIREILVPTNANYTNYTNYTNINQNINQNNDTAFEELLLRSLKESELLFAEEEQKHFDIIMNQHKERKLKGESIVKKIDKIKAFDMKNKEVYETICSIIELWEMEYIVQFETDQDSYDSIRKIIKTIRLTKEEQQFLDELIILTPL
jgi:hypothetical protein